MVSQKLCDATGCKKEAYETVDACFSYTNSIEGPSGITTYKPFEKPSRRQVDLCPEHYTLWCKATYNAINKRLVKEQAAP
jgi:hypothetical protein